MTTTPHTPGPWKVVNRGHSPSAWIIGNGFYLAEMQNDAKANEQVNADARLIAAAPELLAALKDLARVVSHIQDTPLADKLKYVPISAYKEAYDVAKQAIAKAEGK